MPELPDVDHFRRYLARYAEGRRIREVEVSDADVLRNTTPQGLGRALHERRFQAPIRRGKWLIVPTNGTPAVVLHFGMTGTLSWTSRPDGRDPHDRAVFAMDGGELRYRIQRKLGGLWLAADRDEADRIIGPLGPDAAEVDRDTFEELLANRRGKLKSTLMDQELVAGIGNELSDEILWTAKMHPGRNVRDLDRSDRDILDDAMRDVIAWTLRHGRIPREEGWFNSVRDVDDPRCPRCGTRVEELSVGGRTAYRCPRCQRG